jgi:CheY-like chemotaxis protein
VGRSKPFKPVAVVVEDDSLQSSVAATLLEEANFEVVECRTAEEAVGVIKRLDARVSLVFTDINLGPGMDGLELANLVRENHPRATVVITSGNVSGRNSQLATQTYFMPKPWVPLNLLRAAQRARPVVAASEPADAGNHGERSNAS